MDRQYTWSNWRESPTLERLDRAFINVAWDSTLPNSILSSLTHTTSDHVPLKIQISTSVPKSSLFRFENSWTLHPNYHDVYCLESPSGASGCCFLPCLQAEKNQSGVKDLV